MNSSGFSHMKLTDRRNARLYLEQHMCVCVREGKSEERETGGDRERRQTYAHAERNEDF